MKPLVFAKSCDTLTLQEQILSQIKSVQPLDGLSQLVVTGNEEKTVLYVPDELTEKEEDAIRLIVEKHQAPAPLEQEKIAKLQQLAIVRNSKLDSLLVSGDRQTMRSPGETLTWGVKVAQAKEFQKSSNLKDCPLLVIETTAYLKDGVDQEPESEVIEAGVRRLAQVLISKEPLLQEASVRIVGRAGRLEEMIRQATSVEEVQQISLTEGWD
jgi:hypothetical protein